MNTFNNAIDKLTQQFVEAMNVDINTFLAMSKPDISTQFAFDFFSKNKNLIVDFINLNYPGGVKNFIDNKFSCYLKHVATDIINGDDESLFVVKELVILTANELNAVLIETDQLLAA